MGLSEPSSYEKWVMEERARAAEREYCCPERKRLYTECRGAQLRLDYDDNSLQCFGTRESDGDWEGCYFEMKHCCFCGAKLQTLL
jgi:hypothetical protein